MKTILIAAAAATGLAGAAFAQSTEMAVPGSDAVIVANEAMTDLVAIDDDTIMVAPFNVSVDDIEDTDIYSANGERIGEVEDVLASVDGDVVALTADVGGFLGIGEKEVVVSLDQLEWQDDHLVIAMAEDQVEALPEWDD